MRCVLVCWWQAHSQLLTLLCNRRSSTRALGLLTIAVEDKAIVRLDHLQHLRLAAPVVLLGLLPLLLLGAVLGLCCCGGLRHGAGDGVSLGHRRWQAAGRGVVTRAAWVTGRLNTLLP
jgi:hypothetical protein